MRYSRCVIALFVIILSFYVVRAADIGSDTAVTRFNTQQIVTDGDRIAGFAALAGGFALDNPETTGIWDSLFPVSGNISLNSGTLQLDQDMILHNVSDVVRLGNVNGEGHIWELSSSVRCIPTEGGVDTCGITFTFESTKGAAVTTVDFSFDDTYLVEGEDAEVAVDLVVNENYLDNKAIVNLGKTINSVNWHPSKDFIAIGTSSAGAGDELFTYTFDRVGNTLTLLDTVNLGGAGNAVNEVMWHPDGDHLAAGTGVNATELLVYVIDSAGNFGASTSVNLAADANSVDWNSDGTFLAVGTDVSGGSAEFFVYSFTKSPLGLSLDASFEISAAISEVRWNKASDANGEIVIGAQGGSNRLRLFRHDGAGGLVELTTGLTLGTQVNSVSWNPVRGCLVAGLQDNAEGTGGELRVYSFNDDDTLDQEDDNELGDDVLSVQWSHDGRLLASGDDGLGGSPAVALWHADADFDPNGGELIFDNIGLVLNGDITFGTTNIKFTGESEIDGHNHTLNFAPTFTMVVDSNASVNFHNVILTGINGRKLQLTDATSTVSFQNAELVLNGDYTLNKGHFEVLEELKISGDGHFFIYQSPEPSTIRGRDPQAITSSGECQQGFSGRLILEQGVTFSYDISVSNTLIVFEDNTSELVLNSATLHTTVTGLQLTKGKLTVKGESFVASEDQEADGGIMVGDGVAANDFTVYVEPGAVLSHSSGYLIYNNANPDKFKSLSQTARLIRNLDSNLYVQNSLNLHDITIELVSTLVDPVEIAAGKQLSYNNTIIKRPGVALEVVADQEQGDTYLLNGNSSLFLTKGVFPVNVSVSGSNNVLRGTGGISGTVTLSDSASSITNSLMGFIENRITLNNGTLTLSQDLSLAGSGEIVGPGTINVGSSNLCLSNEQLDADTSIFWQGSGGGILLRDNVSLSDTWTFSGQVVLDGRGNELVLSSDAALVVDQGSKLTLKNIRLSDVQSNSIRCLDNDGSIKFLGASMILDGAYTFTVGSMDFHLDNSFSGTHIFTYDSAYTSTVRKDGTLKLKEGVTLSIGRKDISSSVEPLAFENKTSVLHLNDSTLSIGDQGMQVTKGTIRVSRGSNIDINSTSTVNGFMLGNGQSDGDAYIQLDPSSILELDQGHLIYNNADVSGFVSKAKTARMIQGDTFSMHFMKDVEFANETIQLDLASFTVDSGVSVNLTNVALETPYGHCRMTGSMPAAQTIALQGNGDYFLIDSGSTFYTVLVSNTDNTIGGEGNMRGAITLQDSNAELTSKITSHVFSNITMNGGTLVLDDDLYFSRGTMLLGEGTVDVTDNCIHFGTEDLVWTGNTYWLGNGAIHFKSNVTFVGTWTFSGESRLYGNDHTIDLGDTGNFVVDSNSSLRLHEFNVENISNNNIRCVDDTAYILLEDSIWSQPEDSSYTFDTGALRFKHKASMLGDSLFVYSSSQTSTICFESKLVLDSGFTFSYDPGIASKNLLAFEDDTAKLVLKSAYLHATATGMQLTKGRLEVKGDSYLSSDKVVVQTTRPQYLNEGIMFGSGTAADNFSCVIIGGSSLSLTQGTLVYNNTDPNLLIIENKMSLLHILAEARLVIDESLQITTGGIEFGDHATLTIKEGKTIAGSILPLGQLHRMSK